jgi:hypothetical protein
MKKSYKWKSHTDEKVIQMKKFNATRWFWDTSRDFSGSALRLTVDFA